MMDCNLSWNNHMDLLTKNCRAYYIIINVKTYMSASALNIIYHAFFLLGYELLNNILGKLVA